MYLTDVQKESQQITPDVPYMCLITTCRHKRANEIELGITADCYRALLTRVLRGKLPPDKRLIVSRETSGSSVKINKLLETIE